MNDPDPVRMVTSDARDWVVWSFEHDAWWGPGRFGYLRDLASAGRYTEVEARRIEQDANAFGRLNERALPLGQARIWAREHPPSFVCPSCGAESFNPHDRQELYCGRCHTFVGDWS